MKGMGCFVVVACLVAFGIWIQKEKEKHHETRTITMTDYHEENDRVSFVGTCDKEQYFIQFDFDDPFWDTHDPKNMIGKKVTIRGKIEVAPPELQKLKTSYVITEVEVKEVNP